jgi:hypothetical protein
MSNLVKPSFWYITTIVLLLAVGCSYTQQSRNSSLSETPALTPTSIASSIPSAQLDSFRQAVNHAMKAATLSQSAKSKADWQSVANNWQRATDLMKAVPKSSPRYATALQKVEEYQQNHAIALQKIAQASATPTTPRSQVTTQTQASESDLMNKAKPFFNNWVALEWNFDPAVLDLYAPDALIENTRRYPDGQTRVFRFSSQEWKALGVKAMPLAQARGDRNKYSQVTYTVEGDRVRISTQRYSLLKQYSSPRSLLVGPDQTGEWRIFEDISESQP